MRQALALALLFTVYAFSSSAASAETCGHASWYALHSRTASGEMMDPAKLTAAHRTLPFGTRLSIRNPSNGQEVVVRVNDRGPFIKGRHIDLSKAAAERIGLIRAGVGTICYRQTG